MAETESPKRRTRGGPVRRALVVVESPTKVKTIQKFLDARFVVKASMGHVRDLPKSSLGVDVARGFKPKYVVAPGKRKVLEELKRAAARAEALYVATDPDREGEAIGWHLAQELPIDRRRVYRVTFNEITERAVRNAFQHPGQIDQRKVDAQQARRVLDRLVGYSLSPLLWEKVRRGLSAGRVQSVALRLIVDREREIQNFRPEEYWSLHARLRGEDPREFTAALREVDGAKPVLPDEATTRDLMRELEGATFRVHSVTRGERRRHPAPPFITSTLQQEAGRRLGFTAKKTMTVAQQLYEGVELGDEGPVGLITYMRTDSVRVAREAQEQARAWVSARLGPEYLPEAPPVYRSRSTAQEAHEAIRPTDVTRDPQGVAPYLSRDQLALYRLIWQRFVASQMTPALYDTLTVDIAAGRCLFRVQGQTLRFRGFTAIYVESQEEVEVPEEEAEGVVPPLREGEVLTLIGLEPKQHFTQPPPRYTEASLIKTLEELGIGRPSTYAQILSTLIQERGYVRRERRTLFPTELGIAVTDKLLPYFPEIMDVEFTAQMEEHLDEVEEGARHWVDTVREFYEPFARDLARARAEMANEKAGEATGEPCPECGGELLRRRGRFGPFIACSAYPECRYTRDLGGGERAEDEPAGENCPTCGRPMVLKHGRYGKFVACSGYPDCKTTKPLSLGIACPRCGAGEVVERRSKRGRTFYGCSAYPSCTFVLWQRPVPVPCPQCGSPFLVERTGRNGAAQVCVTEGCSFRRAAEVPVG